MKTGETAYEEGFNDGAAGERLLCVADVCKGCEKGWPLDNPRPDDTLFFHNVPESGDTELCLASGIRSCVENSK